MSDARHLDQRRKHNLRSRHHRSSRTCLRPSSCVEPNQASQVKSIVALLVLVRVRVRFKLSTRLPTAPECLLRVNMCAKATRMTTSQRASRSLVFVVADICASWLSCFVAHSLASSANQVRLCCHSAIPSLRRLRSSRTNMGECVSTRRPEVASAQRREPHRTASRERRTHCLCAQHSVLG